MRIVWIIVAIITFVCGQGYLFRCLRRLDTAVDKKREKTKLDSAEDNGGYPQFDVVE